MIVLSEFETSSARGRYGLVKPIRKPASESYRVVQSRTHCRDQRLTFRVGRVNGIVSYYTISREIGWLETVGSGHGCVANLAKSRICSHRDVCRW